MLKVIHSQDILFSKKFEKKSANYSIVYKILEDEAAFVIQSYDSNFLAVQSHEKPMWVWIDEDITYQNRKKMLSEFMELIGDRFIPSITGEEGIIFDIASYICDKSSWTYEKGIGMIAYTCHKIIYDKDISDMELVTALAEHRNVVANLLAEANNMEIINEEVLALAEQLIKSNDLFLLQHNKSIVAMGNIAQRTKTYGRITGVFVPTKFRLRGYATGLTALLSQKIMDEGLVPMLYTDDSNNISNHVYINVGYSIIGKMQNVKLSKKSTV